MRTSALIVGALVVGCAARTAAEPPPLALLTRPGEYFGAVYASPPPDGMTYVFFSGEPVRLQINVVNWGDAPHTLMLHDKATSGLLRVSATRDGAPAHVALLLEADARLVDDLAMVEAIDDTEVRLAPGVLVRWDFRVGSPLPVGLYVLDVDMGATDESGRHLRPQATRFTFEVRRTEKDSIAEVLRRSALRRLTAGDISGAAAEADRVLAVNANSHAAFAIKGEVARLSGKPEEAAAAYAQALSAVISGADKPYLQRASTAQVRDLIDALRKRAAIP